MDELSIVGAAHGRNEHWYATEFSAPSSTRGLLVGLDAVSGRDSARLVVGKPVIWLASVLWGLGSDQGGHGNNPHDRSTDHPHGRDLPPNLNSRTTYGDLRASLECQ